MHYELYIDETGDHGLSFIDKNFPLFLLCGCLFNNEEMRRVESEINEFKDKHFATKEVILHSRDIRKCEGAFQILFDLTDKVLFAKNGYCHANGCVKIKIENTFFFFIIYARKMGFLSVMIVRQMIQRCTAPAHVWQAAKCPQGRKTESVTSC